MNTRQLLLAWGCAVLVAAGGLARAQGETNGPAGDAGDPVESAADQPATGETPAPVEETPAPAPAEPVPPARAPPARRGAELTDAFKGAGSSLYGVKGRTIKLPAKKSVKREKGAWRREFELGVSTAQGNKDNLRYDAALEAAKETENNYFFLKAAGRYGESDDEKDADNATGEAKAQHRLTEHWYVAAEANVYHDQIADLAYRARGSLSLGRYFIRSDRTILAVETGPGYIAEKKGGEQDDFMAGRVAQHLEFLVTASLQVWQAVEYIPSFEDARVYFINAEAGLETVLVPDLSLVFTVEDRFDSNPAEGKERNDLLTSTALKWKF